MRVVREVGAETGWAQLAPVRRLFDPAARAARRQRRAWRALSYRSLATVGLAYLTSRVGVVPGLELGEFFWGTATALTGLSAVRAGRRVWRLERAPRPVRCPPTPLLPPHQSQAYRAIARLGAREAALAELLTALGAAAGDAWREALGAAGTLRVLADRMVSLESARPGVPDDAQAALDAALAALRQRLEEGVSAYERLVSAASDAVNAAATAHVDESLSVLRLEEAADQLAGLARGLREVTELGR